MNKLLFLVLTLMVFFASCEKDETTNTPTSKTTVYIINEGSFNGGNGDLSRYFPDDKILENNSFHLVNGRHLGDIVQSATKNDGKLYCVVNNSNKIEIADASTCAELGVIKPLNQPRYIKFVSNTIAWVSCWGGDGMLVKVDVNSKKIIDSVQTGAGPEELSIVGDNIFVANSGGMTVDSTISVVNKNTSQLVKTIVVGDNPSSMVTDKNGKIWVLCRGKASWQKGETASKLVMINPSTLSVEKTITLYPDKHPMRIQINPAGDRLYVGSGYDFDGIFSLGINESSISQNSLISGIFYGFNIQPTSGTIYCLDAGNFQSAGTMKLYSLTGQLIDTKTVGLGPNSVVF